MRDDLVDLKGTLLLFDLKIPVVMEGILQSNAALWWRPSYPRYTGANL